MRSLSALQFNQTSIKSNIKYALHSFAVTILLRMQLNSTQCPKSRCPVGLKIFVHIKSLAIIYNIPVPVQKSTISLQNLTAESLRFTRMSSRCCNTSDHCTATALPCRHSPACRNTSIRGPFAAFTLEDNLHLSKKLVFIDNIINV